MYIRHLLIQEEVDNMRGQAIALLDELREMGVEDTKILEYIIYNNMSGQDAFDVLEEYKGEL